MAEKMKPVTLTKGTRTITLSTPREVVQFEAAGWRRPKPAADAPDAAAAAIEAPQPGVEPQADKPTPATARKTAAVAKGEQAK